MMVLISLRLLLSDRIVPGSTYLSCKTTPTKQFSPNMSEAENTLPDRGGRVVLVVVVK